MKNKNQSFKKTNYLNSHFHPDGFSTQHKRDPNEPDSCMKSEPIIVGQPSMVGTIRVFCGVIGNETVRRAQIRTFLPLSG